MLLKVTLSLNLKGVGRFIIHFEEIFVFPHVSTNRFTSTKRTIRHFKAITTTDNKNKIYDIKKPSLQSCVLFLRRKNICTEKKIVQTSVEK